MVGRDVAGVGKAAREDGRMNRKDSGRKFRRLNLTVPPELFEKMQARQDVCWSKLACESFERFLRGESDDAAQERSGGDCDP